MRITIDATGEDPNEAERIRLLLSEILGHRHHVTVTPTRGFIPFSDDFDAVVANYARLVGERAVAAQRTRREQKAGDEPAS